MAYKIVNSEIAELKETMGFRVNTRYWNDFVQSHPDGCTDEELIALVKERMNPPYEKSPAELDEYLNSILKIFVNFIRGNALDFPLEFAN